MWFRASPVVWIHTQLSHWWDMIVPMFTRTPRDIDYIWCSLVCIICRQDTTYHGQTSNRTDAQKMTKANAKMATSAVWACDKVCKNLHDLKICQAKKNAQVQYLVKHRRSPAWSHPTAPPHVRHSEHQQIKCLWWPEQERYCSIETLVTSRSPQQV